MYVFISTNNHLHGNGVMNSLVKQSAKWGLLISWWSLLVFKLNTKASNGKQSTVFAFNLLMTSRHGDG